MLRACSLLLAFGICSLGCGPSSVTSPTVPASLPSSGGTSSRTASLDSAEPAAPSTAASSSTELPDTAATVEVDSTAERAADLALQRRLLETMTAGTVEQGWVGVDGLFLLASTGGPVDHYPDVVPVPPGGQYAAMAGRVVAVADVWRIEAGRLRRVWRRATRLQPMVCEVDDCEIVVTDATVTAEGAVEIDDGTCEPALSHLKTRGRSGSTYDVFDHAVVPRICAGRGRYVWNGRTLALARAATASTPAPLMSSARASAGPATGPAGSPRTAVGAAGPSLLAPDDVPPMVFARLFDGTSSWELVELWLPPSGVPLLALFVNEEPASRSSYAPRTRASEPWASGRAIRVAEIWAAEGGSFRRLLRVPVGLAALAEPRTVLAIDVHVDGADVVVGDAERGCVPDSSLAPPDPIGRELDQKLAEQCCASRGRYHYDGRSFRRAR